jgi:hypothetical protein
MLPGITGAVPHFLTNKNACSMYQPLQKNRKSKKPVQLHSGKMESVIALLPGKAVEKTNHSTIKMPPEPEGFRKGRDNDCL